MAATDGVPDEQKPLRVLIAGAGIGGLCTALGLRKQGHHVSIYEQSQLAEETGAAIHIAPNCYGLLERLGLDPRQHGSVELCGLTEYGKDGKLKHSIDFRPMNKMWQHPWDLVHRAHLHRALKALATSADGLGRPVEIHLQSPMTGVDATTGTMQLADGREVQGDLVIGADGVNSKTRKTIPSGDLRPFDSGKSAFRFLVPTKEIAADERTRPFLDQEGHLLMWLGEDRRLVMYPCVSGTMMNFVAIHPSSESSANTKDGDAWQQRGSKERMLEAYKAFGPDVAALLNKADNPRVWTLLDMEQMPHFVHERFAVVGDAAHPFLPHQAQGGAQAIEDAMSLAALHPLGTKPEEVSERLQLYHVRRYERSHKIQEFTRQAGADLKEGETLDMQKFTVYNVAHDEWHASTAALQKHLASRSGTRWRTPIGFGPASGPRQPIGRSLNDPYVGRLRCQTPETSSALVIRFKTSRTYLQSLLPPGFSFVSPATICEATLLVTSLNGMTWLGGGGYNFFMLQLHGIKYSKRDGEQLFGLFIPLLFEDLTDPIVTGRDDLGMPKLYAAIDIQHQGSSATVKLSWRGTAIARLSLNGLADQTNDVLMNGATERTAPSRQQQPDNGSFAWRYVPAVGQPGKVDAEYPVCVPPSDPSKFNKDSRVRIAESAAFEFFSGDWNTLPTLHNVTRGLAEIPNYGIIEAKHVTSTGVDDLASAYRIE